MQPLNDSPLSPVPPLSFATRFRLAWVCLWTVLVDGVFAARVRQLRAHADAGARPSLAPAPTHALNGPDPGASGRTALTATAPAASDAGAPALQLLALLQREGRLVDFLQQDIAPFTDAQVGQVARVVHAGCRKAIAAHADIEPVFSDAESTRVELPAGFDPAAVKLTGQVQGSPPFRGILRHRGWRATRLVLPTTLAGHDPRILAPAEVEL